MSKAGTVPLHSLIEQTAVKWHQPSALRFHSATISLLKGSISTSTASRGPVHLIFYVLQAASWWGSEQKCSGVGHWCGAAISESLCCLLSVTLKRVLHSTDVKAPTSISAQAWGFTKTPPRKSQGNLWIKCVGKAPNESIATTYSATYRSHGFCLNYPSHVISYLGKIILETSLWSFRWNFMC